MIVETTVSETHKVMEKIVALLLLVFCSTKGQNLKATRFLSNPFGLLGYDTCQASLEGRNVTGICHNEVECLLK